VDGDAERRSRSTILQRAAPFFDFDITVGRHQSPEKQEWAGIFNLDLSAAQGGRRVSSTENMRRIGEQIIAPMRQEQRTLAHA
jgi:hypothetical protein